MYSAAFTSRAVPRNPSPGKSVVRTSLYNKWVVAAVARRSLRGSSVRSAVRDPLLLATKTMLKATDLTKTYNGVTALDHLNLEVAPGDVFCLLGANGAGKTTTINLFLNFIEPSGGSAQVNGVDVTEQPLETKRWLAYLPAQVTLYRHLTGLENLDYFTTLSRTGRYPPDQLRAFFKQGGLQDEAADQRVSTYSKGMRQKVGIAIALAKQAKALLLDEPTSGLDPKAANEFSGLLQRLSGEGVAVLMATHDERATQCASRILNMQEGRILED